MADFFWYNPSGSGNWTSGGASSRWYSATGGGGTKYTTVPTAADNAIFDANSGAGICNFPNAAVGVCLNLYCNGYGAVGATTTQISGAPNSVLQVYGNIVLSPLQTFDLKQTPSVVMLGSAAGSITTNGNTFGDLAINKSNAAVTLNDDLIGIGNATLTLQSGTLNANNKNVTFGCFYTYGASTRTLNMGSGTWTMVFESEISNVPFNTWNVNSTTGLTFNKDTATLLFVHARNNPQDNGSQVSGLRNPLTLSSTTIDLVDMSGFAFINGSNNCVLIGNEVIKYTGINTATKQLTGLTRNYGGTTNAISVPQGTAVIGVLFGNSYLLNPLVLGVSTTVDLIDSSLYPPSGDINLGNETLHYTANNLTTNQLTLASVPLYNHSANDPVWLYQARYFYGGGLTYNNVIFAGFGYKVKNYIYGSNTFANIKNSNIGFTWTTTNNKYPGFQELAFGASGTNIITSALSFGGTSTYQQKIYSLSAGTTTTLSIIPATTGWYVGSNSVNGGNNTGLYYVAGDTDYIYWQDIQALPNIPPPATGKFLLLF